MTGTPTAVISGFKSSAPVLKQWGFVRMHLANWEAMQIGWKWPFSPDAGSEDKTDLRCICRNWKPVET